MDELTIALVQIRPGDSAKSNAEKITAFLEEAKGRGAGFVLFPECSLSGYAPGRAGELALSAAHDTAVRSIEKASEELDVAVCFGFMERDGDLFISQELFSRGRRTIYRKTHLGSREAPVFAEGGTFPPALIESGGKSIAAGMQLCWESHIPRISEKYRRDGAELLLFPYASAMSGEKCRENLSVHLPARASDNGCFAAACNLLMDGRGGGMAVWDPKGKMICGYFGSDEKMLLCSIGGTLPRELRREGRETMHSISYFDRARDIF